MRTPKPPKEDPAVVTAREREERRAETSRIEETQAYLLGSSRRRLRRTGALSGSGSVPIYGPTGRTGGGATGGAAGGGGVGLEGRMAGFERFSGGPTAMQVY